ncbi:MAG: hypothetical protein ACW99A_14850 [Candidatus Kariarchaeaceae archaeon]|jgi:hypothetical protein
MKKVTTLFILISLLILTSLQLQASEDTTSSLSYSKYNATKGEWINMTIIDDTYTISSDSIFYEGLSSQFLSNPWWVIAQKLHEDQFFDTSIKNTNPHTVVEVNYKGQYNKQLISQEDIKAKGLLNTLDSILNRLTGFDEYNAIWPTDMQVYVMESYPEQYGVSVSFHRGSALTFCADQPTFCMEIPIEVPARLIVADFDIFGNVRFDSQMNVPLIDEMNVSIEARGESTTISFDTFKVGVDFRPSDLYFFVVLESGGYIHYSPENVLPAANIANLTANNLDDIIQNVSSDTQDTSEDEINLELPAPFIYGVVSLSVLPVFRKFMNRRI